MLPRAVGSELEAEHLALLAQEPLAQVRGAAVRQAQHEVADEVGADFLLAGGGAAAAASAPGGSRGSSRGPCGHALHVLLFQLLQLVLCGWVVVWGSEGWELGATRDGLVEAGALVARPWTRAFVQRFRQKHSHRPRGAPRARYTVHAQSSPRFLPEALYLFYLNAGACRPPSPSALRSKGSSAELLAPQQAVSPELLRDRAPKAKESYGPDRRARAKRSNSSRVMLSVGAVVYMLRSESIRSLLLLELLVAGPAELLARFASGVKLEGPFRPAARTCIFTPLRYGRGWLSSRSLSEVGLCKLASSCCSVR